MSARLHLPPLLLLLLCASHALAYSARTLSNHQQTQALLTSIDERLRNLDKAWTHRHAAVAEQHARKLEALENRLQRFETLLAARLDRIDGNASLQHFKADLDRDQLLRNVEAVYERVHRRVFHVETKIDAGERRITEKLESMLKKFEHLEEATRRTDADEEVVEVLDAIDETKGALHVAIENATKTMAAQFSELQTRLAPEPLIARVHRLEAIANATRHEQQNAARGLVVMVGRLGGKSGDAPAAADCAGAQLADVARKMDARLDALAAQQAVFADSCHRIQSDEPQLESKIGEILEKIVDVFERESAIEAKDIQRVEQLIRTHDASAQRSLFATSHNVAALLQKAAEHKDELAARLDNVTALIGTLREEMAGSQVQLRSLAEAAQRSARIDKNDVRTIGGKLDALDATIRRVFNATNAANSSDFDEASLDAAIREIFAPRDDAKITFQEVADNNCTSPSLDVRMPAHCANCADGQTTNRSEIVTCCCPDEPSANAKPAESSDAPAQGGEEEFAIDLRAEQQTNSTQSSEIV